MNNVEFNALVFLKDNGGTLTNEELAFLETHKINNAIILAAGMSARFVPLSFEIPKGLLKVKGEVLIERQIRQLQEKGIREIVIVTGHMRERFEYLKDKFGVILVEAHDYTTRNNHASVFAAKDYLNSTIISSSDLYFTENIFQAYAYDAYYCVIYMKGPTPERGVITDSDDRILRTMYGEECHDIWVTLGYAYFNERFSRNFLGILEREYDLPETKGKFWADIQDDHYEELYMYAKKIPDGVIHEFDSLEELREFDDLYAHNSGSLIMKTLCENLRASEDEITCLKSLTPSSFAFTFQGRTYQCFVNTDDLTRLDIQEK